MVSFADTEKAVEFSFGSKTETDLRTAALRDVGVHDDVARRLVILVQLLSEKLQDAIASARHAAGDADARLRLEMRGQAIAMDHGERNGAVRKVDGPLPPV